VQQGGQENKGRGHAAADSKSKTETQARQTALTGDHESAEADHGGQGLDEHAAANGSAQALAAFGFDGKVVMKDMNPIIYAYSQNERHSDHVGRIERQSAQAHDSQGEDDS
jgi:hypothetical protein